ncbi:hypothetical protein [Chryseobacterium gossypii]|uniref:hypothetical protein n=1 Tax=Chryseobacterium gossypii TaxID=3231602 RepID=UPI0035254889
MILKVSIKSQLHALRELLIISMVYLGGMYFLYIKTEFDLFKILFLSTFIFYFLVLFLPVIILHINYLNNNVYKNIVIEQNKLIIDNLVYKEDNIDKINIYATRQHFSDSVGVSALPYNDYYYYLEVCLKDGRQINLSSLLDYKIDKIFKENFKSINIIEKPSPFALLFIK